MNQENKKLLNDLIEWLAVVVTGVFFGTSFAYALLGKLFI